MAERLKNCWEIKNCGRQKDGPKVTQLGECVSSAQSLGHSCWAIAGTLCGGVVQGTFSEKGAACIQCDVYKLYHRILGIEGSRVLAEFPEEHKKYATILTNRPK